MEAPTKKAAACALLLVLLLFASEPGAEGIFGHHCRHPSGLFKGLCFSDTNCLQICQKEGYKGGQCHGVRHRCMCC